MKYRLKKNKKQATPPSHMSETKRGWGLDIETSKGSTNMNIPAKANPGTPFGCIEKCETHYRSLGKTDACVAMIQHLKIKHDNQVVFVSITHKAFGEQKTGIMISIDNTSVVLGVDECFQLSKAIKKAVEVYEQNIMF